MSLTGTEGIFAAVHENGINDFADAFFGARPRYLLFGTPVFFPATTVTATQVPAISLGSLGGDIHYAVRLQKPKIDLFKDTFGFALPPIGNDFAIETVATIVVGCQRGRVIFDNDDLPVVERISTELGVCARGKLERGTHDIGFHLEEVEIKDIEPDTLESVIECIMLTVLNAVLSRFRIPYRAITLQIEDSAFGTLSPVAGPNILEDSIQATANFV